MVALLSTLPFLGHVQDVSVASLYIAGIVLVPGAHIPTASLLSTPSPRPTPKDHSSPLPFQPVTPGSSSCPCVSLVLVSVNRS